EPHIQRRVLLAPPRQGAQEEKQVRLLRDEMAARRRRPVPAAAVAIRQPAVCVVTVAPSDRLPRLRPLRCPEGNPIEPAIVQANYLTLSTNWRKSRDGARSTRRTAPAQCARERTAGCTFMHRCGSPLQPLLYAADRGSPRRSLR